MKELFTLIIISMSPSDIPNNGVPNFINTGIQYETQADCLNQAKLLKDFYRKQGLFSVNMAVGCLRDTEID